MPSIVKNKMTTNVLFYRNGVPNSENNFAYLATQNYSVIKLIAKYYSNQNNVNRRSNINFL